MSNFHTINNAAPAVGLVLRTGSDVSERLLRVTHVFPHAIYVMDLWGLDGVRRAKRPIRMPLISINRLLEAGKAVWGNVELPPALTVLPSPTSDATIKLQLAWNRIEPLIALFKHEHNLQRDRFTAFVRERSRETGDTFLTIYRLLLRFYYFGSIRAGLLPLPRGSKPRPAAETAARKGCAAREGRRRGRQPVLAYELGKNDFAVSAADIDDMVNSYAACLRKGPACKTIAHEEYLANWFRIRHPKEYGEYILQQRLEPVTIRQYRYYTDKVIHFEEQLQRNERRYKIRSGSGIPGSVRAAGPGEIYEIDSTGGRIHLVSSTAPTTVIGKPTLYRHRSVEPICYFGLPFSSPALL